MFLFCFQITKFSPNQAWSRDFKKHKGFDFARQVHLPSNPMQPGPLYSLVPRKVGIFGIHVPVCCEGLPKR